MTNRKASILIVDDEPATRTLLAQIFIARGHAVATAHDGFSALKLIRLSTPDVVLSDLNMPGMSGFELLSILRRRLPSIFVIASSGAYVGSIIPDGIAADAFYEKASGLDALFKMVTLAEASQPTSPRLRSTQVPIWLSLEETALAGHAEILIACPECLRNFPHTHKPIPGLIQKAHCIYCHAAITYAVVAFLGRQPEDHYHAKLDLILSTTAPQLLAKASA
jgi:CheY-like chemotaxis protein